jgi:hypothetical protein
VGDGATDPGIWGDILMWWTLLAALRDHLAAILNLVTSPPTPPSDIIIIGGDGLIPKTNTIILKRGPAKTNYWLETWSGINLFFIESWSYDLDDPEQAYINLMRLESRIVTALAQPITLAGYELNTRITAIDPDGDVFRPSVGSQMTVEIEWRTLP